jgi:hypothetical protein
MTDIELNNMDMVYNTVDGKAVAGGYLVNSVLLNEGMAAYGGEKLKNHNNAKVDHSKVSDRFKHLAIPAGLLYINESIPNNTTITNDSTVVNDDLYEKLLKLAGPKSNKNKQTKKRGNNKKDKKKTKRVSRHK